MKNKFTKEQINLSQAPSGLPLIPEMFDRVGKFDQASLRVDPHVKGEVETSFTVGDLDVDAYYNTDTDTDIEVKKPVAKVF